MSNTQLRSIRGLAVPVVAAAAVLAPAALATQTASAAAAPAGTPTSAAAVAAYPQHYRSSGVTISGKKWLDGKGVNVYRSRMCGELAVRLYAAKGWGSIRAGYAGVQTLPRYSSGVKFHRNGSGYVPVPGDIVVESGGAYGHVAIVDRVTKNKVITVEQNASPSGWHTYSWNAKRTSASGAYGARHVSGFVHSPKNKNTN